MKTIVEKHEISHLFAGKTVRITSGVTRKQFGPVDLGGIESVLEDYWDRLVGRPLWRNDSDVIGIHTPAEAWYALAVEARQLPRDNEVVYGKINGLGYLFHASELDLPVA